ncbi:hypothetical protein llap_17918 [Limosa lapponica baueri]|uniref:Nucleophosmin n=1 Tax=Limosa lapponica baueri TaxID=1758121 RepID=A0A2I0TD93_LIMLA|nr:hypothetical protein llap_17918 [Limosa lapponica baueri]
MEDSAMDMESMGPLRPQTFLFASNTNLEKFENEFTVTLGPGAKDELHVVEAEALDYEGNPVKVALASLKMSVQPTKKAKLADDDEDDDEDDEDDDEDEDDLEDDEEEMKTPIKKTPDSKKDKSLTPKTPKVPLSLEEIKAKMQASVDKGSSLPKLEPKFANYVKNCFRTEDQKVTEFIGT